MNTCKEVSYGKPDAGNPHVVPMLRSAAVGLLSVAALQASAYERGDVLLHLPLDGSVQPVSGTVTVRSGTPAFTNDTPNSRASSLHVTTSRLQLNIPKDGLLRPALTNATIEFFIKGMAAPAWATPVRLTPFPDDVGKPPFPFLMQVDNSGCYYLRADCYTNQLVESERQTVAAWTKTPFADQTWHHVAMVVSANTNGSSHIRHYIDYALVGKGSSSTFPWSGLEEGMTLDFGGQSGLDYCVSDFRISYGSLEPCEFDRITGEAQDGETLYHLTFDDETVTSNARSLERGVCISGTPVYSASDLPGGKIYSGDASARTGRDNLRSLYCNKTRIRIGMPMMNLQYPSLTSATIEFFMKGSTISAWGVPLQIYNPDSSSNPPFPILVQANSDLKLNLRVDCGKEDFSYSEAADINALTVNMGRAFADDAWHHYAVTIEPASGNLTTAKFYLDHMLIGTKTSTEYAWKGVSVVQQLGLGYSSTVCWIDEVRISKGVLAPEQFLDTERALNKVLVYLPFDGDLTSLGRSDCVPTNVPGNVSYSDKGCRDKVMTTYESDGVPRVNLGSLYVTNCVELSFPGEAMRKPNFKNATIEFFIRGDAGAVTAWRCPMKIYNTLSHIGNPPFPLLFQVRDNGKGFVRLDAFDDVNQARESADARETISSADLYPFNDQKWHHVAVTIAAAEGGLSTYRWYLDYKLVKEATTTKFAWSGLTANMRMQLDGGVNFRYWVDEFRISGEALDPGQFIRKFPYGFSLFYK